MKRSELIFNVVSIPVDIVSLFVAGLASFYIRLKVRAYIPIVYHLDLHEYIKVIAISIPLLLLLFVFAGLYNLRGTRKFATELQKITSAVSIGLLIFIIIFFFNQRVFPSRFIVLASWLLAIIIVVIGRFILKKIQGFYLNRGLGLHRLVIINGPGSEVSVINAFKNKKQFGYNVIAELEGDSGLIPELERLYRESGLEEILQANPNLSQSVNFQLVQFARNKGLVFNYIPHLYEVQNNAIDTETVQGIPVISLKNTPLDGWGKVVKRIFDIIASTICIIITLPVFIIIAILIKLDSPGKIMYAVPRGGHKKDFIFFKFRSMYTHLSDGDGYGGTDAYKFRLELWKVNARGGAQGPFLKIKDDPRVTRVGKFLRKTKLDELPQFLNVLKGDMSMIGPRAHVIDEVERYRDMHRRLFTIKPGIFGLAQIAQLSWPDLPFEEEVRLNTYYIENWTLWLDIKILAKSAYYLFFSKRVDY